MSDFNKILSAVKGAVDSQHVNIFVPSANNQILFRPLTAKQQKDLVKTAVDTNLGAITFQDALNNILTTNCLLPHAILVSDRQYLTVMLRALTLTPKYVDNNVTYDLLALKNNNTPLADDLKAKTITVSDFIIKCKVPTLKQDSIYNGVVLKQSAEKKDNAETFGDLFIYEVLKYVERIECPSLQINVAMSELSMHQQYQLIDSLPATAYNEIVDYINSVKTSEESLFKIDNVTLNIDVDQGFFTP